MRTHVPLQVHWVRHGKIVSHQGDVPVTDDGLQQACSTCRKCNHDATSASRIRRSCEPSRVAIFWARILESLATVSR